MSTPQQIGQAMTSIEVNDILKTLGTDITTTYTTTVSFNKSADKYSTITSTLLKKRS